MKPFSTASSVCLSLILAGSLIGSAEARNLRLSHNQGEDHPVHKSMQWMADRVSELTGGDLTIEIYPSSQLGTQRESVELVQTGALDMAKTNASELEAFDPIYAVFNVPYVFADRDHFYKVITGKPGKEILQHSRDKGFIGLTYYDGGARSFYANKAINTPADLKGLKVRVQPSPSAIRMIELLGGSATPLPYGELYTALQQGVVDAAENNETALTNSRHGEVAKIFSEDEHTRIPDVLVISTFTWDSLTPDEQKALQQAADESLAFHKDLWAKDIEKARETAKNEMNVEFKEVDKEPFRKATQPFYDEVAGQSEETANLLKEIRDLE
ncbi:TRAP transporter substrate-binding protein [Consotaella salsifontis]|uniref:Tripartite ATP-independent transporter solute receptor, DctP family n=1 Tax=Consotaella salsifontis TaxID=1365950 RepID=A0A1T4R9J9_9HYPH|nr:TRAP transporter substrate-binding protein [Consotaella salsifontis]SKA12633.1 tripartite ATP-independent transporter solute receptor, DctP family [Consotaella salsifontis]